MYRNELTPFEQEMVDFYKSINPALDFAYRKGSEDDKPEYVGGSNVKKVSGGKSPLEFKLTEAYVDLGLALEKKDWIRAEIYYHYLRRVTGIA